jgi:hypothetical protein
MSGWDGAIGARFTGCFLGSFVAVIPFMFWNYRLDLVSRGEGMRFQLSRLLERRFSHQNVAGILERVDAEVAAAREARPAVFPFEAPIDAGAVVDRRRRQWDERAPSTWGCDPRVSVELHSKAMAFPTNGLDRVLTDIASARDYVRALEAQQPASRKSP